MQVQSRPQRYPIRRAIHGGLGGLVTLGMIVLVISAWLSVSTTDANNAVVLRSYQLLDTIRDIQLAEEATRSAVLVAEADATPGHIDAISTTYGDVRKAMRSLVRLGTGDAEMTSAQEAASATLSHWYESWATRVAGAVRDGDAIGTDPNLALASGDALFDQVRADAAALDTLSATRIASAMQQFTDSSRATLVGTAIAAVLLCLGLLFVGRWLLRTVTGPLKRLNETAFAQLNGDEVEFTAERDDEVGALAHVLERLRRMVEERYAGAREEARRAETLNKLGDLIAFSTAEYEVIDGTVRALRRLVDTRRGDVQLTNASRNRVVYAGSWGPNPPGLETPVPVDRIDRCPAIRRAAPFIVADVEDDLAVLCPAHPVDTGSLACVPLIAMGQPIGVIHLESATVITDEMVAVTMRLAEQVAVALANARLMTTMEGLAMTDGLTGLRNARFFDSYLDQELAAAERDHEPLSVLMLDIDHFKDFNDTHGHPAGDEALRIFGRVLRATLRSSDMPARYGGEEFVVALRHTDIEGAVLVAEKIREAVSQAVVEIGPGRFGRLTVSIGAAEADLSRIDQKALVSSADAALYRAKGGGRNRVVVGRGHPADGPGEPGERREATAVASDANVSQAATGTSDATASGQPIALAPRRRRRRVGPGSPANPAGDRDDEAVASAS